MRRHGAGLGEGLLPACCASQLEPPTHEPVPALDGAASSHGSQGVWGHSLEKNTTYVFQNIRGLFQRAEGDRDIKLHTLLNFIKTN